MTVPDHPQPRSTPLARAVSYAIVTGGGGLVGFLLALCSMGGVARYPGVIRASDAAHGGWIVGCTVAGGAFGFILA